MEQGYIKITENDNHEFTVETKLVNGTIWLPAWEIASLFNVFTIKIDSNLKAIFKAGLLKENDVSRVHRFIHEGHKCEKVFYNLDAIIHLSFRIASFEAKAFREAFIRGFSEYSKMDKHQTRNILVIWGGNSKTPFITSLN